MPDMTAGLLAAAHRQGITGQDLNDPNSDWNRQMADQDFEDYMAQYPGAAPNGTGPTGLGAGDAAGWSNLLNRQTRYLQDKAKASGSSLNVKFGGYSPMTSITGSGGSSHGGSGMGTGSMGYSDPFMEQEAEKLSLQGLRNATQMSEAAIPNAWTQYYENQDAQDAALQGPRFREQAFEAGDPDAQRENLIRTTQTKEMLADRYATPDALRALKAQVAGIPLEDQLSDAKIARTMTPWAESARAEKNQDTERANTVRYLDPVVAKNQSAADLAAGKNANALDVANTKANADRYRAAFTAISGIIGKLQAAGAKPEQIAPYQSMLTAMGQSQPPGAGGGGGVISEADIEAAMAAKGWTREQAVAEAQKRGLTVR